MTADRFGNLFGDGKDDDVMARAETVEIVLHKSYADDGELEGVFGTFKVSGEIGKLGEYASLDDLGFVRKLLDKFERAEN